jgi:hypothetical protein
MSHHNLRTETNCLNCDAQVDGQYCKNCGQENIEPKQTLWSLLTHFFEDITHFDSKFFITMKTLLLKPGFLTSEYIIGRRKKYLDPIRMYLFVSFVFFLLYLFFTKIPDGFNYENDTAAMHIIDTGRIGMDARKEYSLHSNTINGRSVMWINFSHKYKHGLKHYDSLQKLVPKSEKLSWPLSYYDRKLVNVANAYDANPYDFIATIINNFLHSFSKVFFFSLPIFSFLLFLFYIRRRKEYYYVSHAIFALHVYSVAWFFLAIGKIKDACFEALHAEPISILSWLVNLGLLAYVYAAMLGFYKQGWFKTFVKFIIILMLMLFVLVLIVMGLLANSFFIMGSH